MHVPTVFTISAKARVTRCAEPTQAGVTLFELVVVILIVAILAAVGVPTYRYVTTTSRMSSELNGLLGDLQYARAEAVREGQTVTVCIADSTVSPYSCASSGTTTWQNGWLVFTDVAANQTYDSSSGDTVLRVQKPFAQGDTLESNNDVGAVTFNRDGFAYLGAAQVTLTMKDSAGDAAYTRCLYLSQSGMMSTTTHLLDPNCT